MQPPLQSNPFLWKFSNKEQTSMKGVVWKEKLLIYLSKFSVNGNPQELGPDATKVIYTSSAHSKIDRPNMSIAPHIKECSRPHHRILLKDGP